MGPWSSAIIHRRFFNPACISRGPLSRFSLSAKPASENGEKSGLVESPKFGIPAIATIDLNRRYVDDWLGDMRARFMKELRFDVKAD